MTQPRLSMWYWDENSISSFEEILNRTDTKIKLNEISNSSDANSMVNGINLALREIARICGAKKKHYRKTRNAPSWYDKDCEIIKGKIKKLVFLRKDTLITLRLRRNYTH